MVVQVYIQCRHSIVPFCERGVDEFVVFQTGEYGFNTHRTVDMCEAFQMAAWRVFFGEPESKRLLRHFEWYSVQEQSLFGLGGFSVIVHCRVIFKVIQVWLFQLSLLRPERISGHQCLQNHGRMRTI